ncbi:Methyltransferase-like protein 7B [Pteropus alecto]|uniref:Methyltransferase-like protein 7B n=1 Tax=Pteropus alecto TaxID=9402 RepID=L5KUW5_PTEAL|nr:Methyltransferase-like protein 7B [Pteropus alecto]
MDDTARYLVVELLAGNDGHFLALTLAAGAAPNAAPAPDGLLGCWRPLCKSYSPYLIAVLTAKSSYKMESKKWELFGQIEGLMGASAKVELLDLGCGTGASFQFYPAGCRITCLDPNPHFEKFLVKSMAENRHLQHEHERFVVAPGEDMTQLADGSMDVVVSTLVLCSVQSPRRVLQEVQRVLRPVSRMGRVWA